MTRKKRLLDDVFLQPWFIDFETACAIRRLVPLETFRKLRFYFDDWGCMVCERRDCPYASNGMCSVCAQRIQKRLFFCLKRREMKVKVRQPQQEYDRIKGAKTLLSDLVAAGWSPKRMRLRKIKWD
jgi:hypothetical protein